MPQPSAPSAGQLLQFIRRGQARTRRDLMELTGLARSTIAQRVDQLVSSGYVREGGVDASTGGRRPSVLQIDEGSAVVLAADLGATHGRVAVVDLAGRALAESAGRLVIADGPRPVLGWVKDRFGEVLAEAGRSLGEVCGVGIGVPGPVDVRTGRVLDSPLVPGWPDYDVAADLGAAYPGPIMIDNDANVMALGEYVAADPPVSALLLVKVGTAIGAGIVEDGRLLHGAGGAAGEIGHVRVPGHEDLRCGCGRHGCLVAIAGGRSLARRLDDVTGDDEPVRDTADVVRLVAAEHPEAVRLIREAGRALGDTLATVISTTNPATLVVSGALATTGEHLIAGIREAVYQQVQYRSTRGLVIGEGRLGERAGVVGAASMVIDRVFSPAFVDARIARAERLRTTG